jgi:hypothetical protein
MIAYVARGAEISDCGKYRYRLWREWRLGNSQQWDMWTEDDGSPALDGAGQQIGEPLACVFVMLNPSTADGNEDDPTIRRCVSFAQREGYDRLEVINLFSYRATDPKALLALNHNDDPVGTDNERHVDLTLNRAGLVICGWGVHGGHIGQDETMLGWLQDRIDLLPRQVAIMALGITKAGHPRHPLYLPSNAPLISYNGLRQLRP